MKKIRKRYLVYKNRVSHFFIGERMNESKLGMGMYIDKPAKIEYTNSICSKYVAKIFNGKSFWEVEKEFEWVATYGAFAY